MKWKTILNIVQVIGFFSVEFVHQSLCHENEDDVLSNNKGKEEIVIYKRTVIEQSCGMTEPSTIKSHFKGKD